MKQKGSTLIVVLLLLVLMTLMSFALMRSTDVAALIAGNVANKQASVEGGDVALIAVESVLSNLVNNGTTPTKGYSSTAVTAITNKQFSDNSITWSDTANVGDGSTGATYNYFIDTLSSGFYRVTIQVSGTKGSKSYFEALYSAQ